MILAGTAAVPASCWLVVGALSANAARIKSSLMKRFAAHAARRSRTRIDRFIAPTDGTAFDGTQRVNQAGEVEQESEAQVGRGSRTALSARKTASGDR